MDSRDLLQKALQQKWQQSFAPNSDVVNLLMAINQIYRYPLRQSAVDQLNRQLRSGINDQQLSELVVALYQNDRLCLVQEEVSTREPQIICSMGFLQGA